MGAKSKPKTKTCPKLYENAGPFCVRRYHKISTFNAAQRTCLNDRATLIEFDSLKESQTVEKHFRKKSVTGFWYWTGMEKGIAPLQYVLKRAILQP